VTAVARQAADDGRPTTRVMRGTARYLLVGHPGVWRYVGQAVFADDDGLDVEHEWVRMVPVGVDGPEAWVDPADATEYVPAGRASA
jgi:hypothetical protein